MPPTSRVACPRDETRKSTMACRPVRSFSLLFALIAPALRAQSAVPAQAPTPAATAAAAKVDAAAIRQACAACARLAAKADEDVRNAVLGPAAAAVRADPKLLEPLVAALEAGAPLDDGALALLDAAGAAARPFAARLAALGKSGQPDAVARSVLALRPVAPYARDPAVLAALARGVDHPDAAVRQAAVELLLDIAPESPALRHHYFEKLVTRGEELGLADAGILARVGLDAGLARFVVARLCSDSRVEASAAAALVKRLDGRSAAVLEPALLDALRTAEPGARVRLIDALAPLGPAAVAAAPDLVHLASDPEAEVRVAALHSLTAIAPRTEELATAAVRGLRDDDDDVRQAAGAAFGDVAAEHLALFLNAPAAAGDAELRTQLVTMAAQQLGAAQLLSDGDPADAEVGRRRDEAFARENRLLDLLLAAARDRSEEVRVAAVERLSAAAGPPPRVLDALGAALSDPAAGVRKAAADAVHEIGEPALPLLPRLAAALDDADHDAQLAKGEALAALFGALSTEALAAALPPQPADLSVEELAAQVDREHADGGTDLPPLTGATVGALVDALANPADPRHAVALELAREEFDRFDRAAETALIRALGHADREVRRAAASWLDSDSPDAAAAQQALLKRLGDDGEPDDEVAAALVESLASFRPVPIAALEPLLDARDPRVRRRGLSLLAAIGVDARALAPKVVAKLSDPDASVREEACRTFYVLVVQRFGATRD
jgi:HEAT repeat protein